MNATLLIGKFGKVISGLLTLIKVIKAAVIVKIIFVLLIILLVGIKFAKKRMARHRATNTSTSHPSKKTIDIDLHISVR